MQPHLIELPACHADKFTPVQLAAECISGYLTFDEHNCKRIDDIDYDTLARLLRAPQHSQSCPSKEPSGLPVCEIVENWTTDRRCGVRFQFSCGNFCFKKFQRFQPGCLQKSTGAYDCILVQEPCRRCGGSGIWRGVDVSVSDCRS